MTLLSPNVQLHVKTPAYSRLIRAAFFLDNEMPRMNNRPVVSGTFTPPDDLQPAIDALSKAGRDYLVQQCIGREVTHHDIAKAADFERGELNG